MRQALEMALDWIQKQPEETPESKYDVDTRYVVLRELEAALAQPEQEYDVVAGVGKGVEIPAGVKYYYIEPKLPPQRKPLNDEMRKQMKESCDSDNMEMRGAFIDGWTSAEAAHNIKE